MLNWLASAMRQVFPFPLIQSVDSYVEYYSQRMRKKNIRGLEELAERASIKNLKQLHEHALRYQSEEQDRGSSIISRAQALLVAQTFFGALLAFSTAIVGRIELFSSWRLPALVATLGYVLCLIFLLTLNALRATAGLPYQRMGTSDLLEWLLQTERILIKNLAVSTLANYRRAGIVNTWRSTHLDLAQQCLRNIVLVLALLVVLVLATVAFGNWPDLWPTTQTNAVPYILLPLPWGGSPQGP